MTIRQLLEWIDGSFSCGSLTLEAGARSRSFHFDSGYVTNASSDDPAEHLGQILLSRGYVEEVALNEAFRVQADTGVRLGKILLMVGAVDEPALREALELKISEALSEALTWTDGTFAFEPDPSTAISEYEVSVNLRDALEMADERRHEWRDILAVIPSDDTGFFVKDATGTEGDERTTEILRLVEDGQRAGRIMLALRGLRFQVYGELAGLVRAGVLGIDQRRLRRAESQSGLPADQLADAARGRATRGDKLGALEMVLAALEYRPDDPDVLALKAELERTLFAELSREMLTSFRVPKLLKQQSELAAMDLDEAERYLTGRIDGRWDLLSLMRAAPLRQLDVLLTCKRLADRGIIAL